MFLDGLKIIKEKLEQTGMKVYLDFSNVREKSVYLELQEYEYSNTLDGKKILLTINISCVGDYAPQTRVLPMLEEISNKIAKVLDVDKPFKILSTTLDISPNPIMMAQTTIKVMIESSEMKEENNE